MIEKDPNPEPTPNNEPDESGESQTPEEKTSGGWRIHHGITATAGAVVLILVLANVTGRLDTLARDAISFFEPQPAVEEAGLESTAEAPEAITEGVYSFEQLDIHPDVMFRPYTAGSFMAEGVASSSSRRIEEFRELLDLYTQRQGVDDNFTIRVVDRREDELLQLYVLEEERDRYEQLGDGDPWDWGRIDRMRRTLTRQLVDRWAARGVPREDITVKWGRSNQVLEARTRDEPFIEYEMRLARYLGLSLLATEIGTVETFNQDRLVSSVGARSRYQMMPYILRQNDIHHYSLPAAAGNRISVYEEWHPLITMEASFRTLAGYIHAVGHEIPGISAYHTGPGNIYSVYRAFLTDRGDDLARGATVMDAYMWAVTEGYDQVSANTSFKSYSRGYVASAYGALRATEDVPIDTTRTLRAERVRLKSGESILLSQLISGIQKADSSLIGDEERSAYDEFAELNQHIVLPPSSNGGIPPRGNLRLSSTVSGVPVRFFLPPGSVNALRSSGIDVVDEVFAYDRNTFGRPSPAEVTIWDRQYRDLVNEVAAFGFNNEIRQRLYRLVDRFEELAEANPTHYRLTQLDVIKTHERIWRTGIFNRLAAVVEDARGRSRMNTQPLSPLNSVGTVLPLDQGS